MHSFELSLSASFGKQKATVQGKLLGQGSNCGKQGDLVEVDRNHFHLTLLLQAADTVRKH